MFWESFAQRSRASAGSCGLMRINKRWSSAEKSYLIRATVKDRQGVAPRIAKRSRAEPSKWPEARLATTGSEG